MSPYSHLLCSIDFSDVSRRALEWSLKFSGEVGADLTVLHVVDTGLTSIGNLVAVPDALDELRQRAEEQMTSRTATPPTASSRWRTARMPTCS